MMEKERERESWWLPLLIIISLSLVMIACSLVSSSNTHFGNLICTAKLFFVVWATTAQALHERSRSILNIIGRITLFSFFPLDVPLNTHSTEGHNQGLLAWNIISNYWTNFTSTLHQLRQTMYDNCWCCWRLLKSWTRVGSVTTICSDRKKRVQTDFFHFCSKMEEHY